MIVSQRPYIVRRVVAAQAQFEAILAILRAVTGAGVAAKSAEYGIHIRHKIGGRLPGHAGYLHRYFCRVAVKRRGQCCRAIGDGLQDPLP